MKKSTSKQASQAVKAKKRTAGLRLASVSMTAAVPAVENERLAGGEADVLVEVSTIVFCDIANNVQHAINDG